MYEARLRRLLLGFYVLLGVIGVRAFALQVLEAEYDEGKSWASLAGYSREFVVHPRRGEIFWADGTKMAWNVPSFGLEIKWNEVDHRIVPTVEDLRAAYPDDLSQKWRTTLEARLERIRPKLLNPRKEIDPPQQRRWTCTICSSERSSWGAPTRACGDCGALAYEMAPPVTVAELASIVGQSVHRTQVALIAAMQRWEFNQDWSSHALLVRIPEPAVEYLSLRPAKYAGFLPLPRNGREFDPLARLITGSTRLPSVDDVERLTDKARLERDGLHQFTANEVYPSLVGASLIEQKWDEVLRGVPGRSERVRLRENEFETTVNVIRPVQDGPDLRTTLRRDVQELAFEVVAGAPEGGHGSAVVIDVRTGAVVAMASTENDALDHARSHFTPGSVYKLVTAVALLEAGHSPDETVYCNEVGYIPGGGKYICMHKDEDIAFHDAFVRSCNGYFSQQADAVGADALVNAAKLLGLERRPLQNTFGNSRSHQAGLELSQPGVGDPELWGRWNLVHIGIGQGAASASPLQIAVAYARIASGGRKIEPFVLERFRKDPASIPVDPVLARCAPIIIDAARDVVTDEEHGTAYEVPALHAIRAAGKTGTADVIMGGKKLNNSSFVGFAPFDDPRYCAIVSFEGTAQKVYGGGVAGDPVARLLAKALDE